MDLEGAGGYFRWTASSWADVLLIGMHYGWQPIGTGPPRGTLKAEWSGESYFANDGALFYARDAKALACALERAVAEMPAKKPRALRTAINYDSMVSDEGKKDLREFIEFCRAGSFRLY